MKQLTILGATGSIGQNTLAVLERNPGWELHALTAHTQIDKLAQQCLHHAPRYAVVADQQQAAKLSEQLASGGCRTEVKSGEEALDEVAADPAVDTVMAAIVGAAGLMPTLAAVKAGKRVLLANKEALVMAGQLFMQAAAESGSTVLPVDSEHNAILQCLPIDFSNPTQISKVILTASGGPFLHFSHEQLRTVSPAQACAHPNWDMGQKISVDSATMMNKGLELIEACYLFGLQATQVEVLIHPQSIVHSLVYYRDGSALAQMANPDMRVPIAAALNWPERLDSGAETLDLAACGELSFQPPDLERFPCLALGRQAAEQGGTMPAVVNAANEVAVQAFLAGKLPFTQISAVIAEVMGIMPCEMASSLAIIQHTDTRARALADNLI